MSRGSRRTKGSTSVFAFATGRLPVTLMIQTYPHSSYGTPKRECSANAPERRAHAAQPAIPSSANSQPSLSPSSASSTGMNSDGEEESGISPTTRKSPGSFIITVPAVDNDSRAFQEARRDFTRAVKSGNVLVVVDGKRLCHLDSTALANISPRLPQLVNTSLGIEFTKGVGLPVALFQPKYVVVADGSTVRVALYAYLPVGQIKGDRPDNKRSSWAVRLMSKELNLSKEGDKGYKREEEIDFIV
ncbi:hypothetical protein FOZ61_000326 [Perkinsus olseni]|uniref:Uncharacterized protein n=1 Tax=Perkinsus olseni TaxID=32597 RepID=A0A7J6KU90_PEROL|nr:hypothetical protein FOZ61_000326 [Perkinsus olseni]